MPSSRSETASPEGSLEGGRPASEECPRGRFRRESDWFRLVILGLILMVLALPCLMAVLGLRPLPIYAASHMALASGAALAILIAKIARPDIYWDWLAGALCLIVIGHLLEIDDDLSNTVTLAAFAGILLASSASRAWLARSSDPPGAGAPLLAAASGSAMIAAAIVLIPALRAPTALSFLIALDVLIQGLAILSFGFSLKAARR